MGHVSQTSLRGHLVKPLIQCGVRLWVEILPLVPQWLRLLLRYVLGRLLDSHATATRIAFVVGRLRVLLVLLGGRAFTDLEHKIFSHPLGH